MAIVTQFPTARKTLVIRHYAYYGDDYGIAEKTGGGYLFRPEQGTPRLAAYNDPQLTLLGRCDLADAQRQADEAAGGLAALVCGYGKGR